MKLSKDETLILFNLVDEAIRRTAKNDDREGEGFVDNLSALFNLRAKLTCGERKGRKKCDLPPDHNEECSVEGVPFSAKAGWITGGVQ